MSLGHLEWMLFGWVLANQGGVPLPVVPILLAAGALAASGRAGIWEVGAIAVGATLCADLGWYAMGRWRGAGVLALLGRLSPNARAFVRRAHDAFLARPGRFQLTARFLPELNPIAAGMAGATALGLIRFVGYGIVSALLWVGAWTGIGYLLGDTVVNLATHYGIHLIGFFLAALLLSLVVRRARRHRLLRMLQKARISADELKGRLERGEPVTILDVRGIDEVAEAPLALPGALWIRPDDLPQRLHELPRDVMVVLYGRRVRRTKPPIACANTGPRVRPLAGGLSAWRRRGYPVQAADAGGR